MKFSDFVGYLLAWIICVAVTIFAVLAAVRDEQFLDIENRLPLLSVQPETFEDGINGFSADFLLDTHSEFWKSRLRLVGPEGQPKEWFGPSETVWAVMLRDFQFDWRPFEPLTWKGKEPRRKQQVFAEAKKGDSPSVTFWVDADSDSPIHVVLLRQIAPNNCYRIRVGFRPRKEGLSVRDGMDRVQRGDFRFVVVKGRHAGKR